MNQTANSKKKRYITGFDGIRTIAVIGVILYHLFPQVMRGGYFRFSLLFQVILLTTCCGKNGQKIRPLI